MSTQLKFSSKKNAGGTSAGQAFQYNTRRYAASKMFTGKCEGLRGEIFDCGQVKHLEVYHKTREAILNYIRVNFKEGDKTNKMLDARRIDPKPQPPVPADWNDLGEMEYWKYKMKHYVDSEV